MAFQTKGKAGYVPEMSRQAESRQRGRSEGDRYNGRREILLFPTGPIQSSTSKEV
jgi:hypothetical protein